MKNPPEIKDKSYHKSMALCNAWDTMMKKYGPNRMATKMMKTPSYRSYIQKWPYDFRLAVSNIDDLEQATQAPSIEDEVHAKIELEKFEASLTPRQQEVWEGLKDGKNNTEIEETYGFQTNNAVRWQKHMIKKIHEESTTQNLHEYACKDCAWIFKEASALDCPHCGSRNLLRVTIEDKPF